MINDPSRTDASHGATPAAEPDSVSPTDETFALAQSPTSASKDASGALPPASQAASDDLATIDQPMSPAASFDFADSGESEDRCGRYELRVKIGGGSYGIVYRGWDPRLHREVAIKIARREKLRSDENVGRFLDEARRMAGIDHPGVVPVYDFGQCEDGACFIVSKLIAGANLREEMECRRFSPTEAASLAADIADALHEVHRQGVIHRDVTPANILIDAKGRPLVSDFGLSLSHDDFGAGPQLCGTAAYMSPEQAAGRADKLDARSDIYSLGVILFELVLGKRPYRSASPEHLLREIADERVAVPPPRQVDESVPEDLERIILKALEKRPSARYSTARDLATDLRAWLGKQTQPKLAGATSRTGHAPWRSAMAATGVLLALAAGGALFFRGVGDEVEPQPSATALQSALRIEGLQIQQLVRLDSGVHGRRGPLLQVPCTLREGDGVQLEARLSRPAYCYWIAFEPDGEISLCFPENRHRPPEATREPTYPWSEAERSDTFFGFDDGAGWQAFLLVVSEEPLPSFEEWSKQRGPAPWRPEELAIDTMILRHDGAVVETFPIHASGSTRGAGSKTRIADGGLAALVRWARSDANIAAVEGYSLPIRPANTGSN